MMLKTRHYAGFLAACFLHSGIGQASSQDVYSPFASEYSLSGPLSGDQVFPALAFDALGGYVVWRDGVTDGIGTGISAQRLNDNLSGVLAPFRVNAGAEGNQDKPSVGMLQNGGAAFVWQGGEPGMQDVYLRIARPDGTFATGDIRVNSYTNQFQICPAMAVLSSGNIAIVWSSYNQDGHLQGVAGRLFDSQGTAIGGEISINQATLYNQRTPQVAALVDGGFVVTWISESRRGADQNGGDAFDVDVMARMFNANGAGRGDEFKANEGGSVCANAAIKGLSSGGFIMVWGERSSTSRNDGWDVYARGFGSAGVAAGGAARVNSTTYGDQYAPILAGHGASVMVIWTSMGQDGSYEGVFGQVVGATGNRAGNEFRVNSTTFNKQMHPAVTAHDDGRFLVVWSSYSNGGPGFDLFAQRYSASQPLPVLAAPSVSALSQSRLAVSWAELAGFDVAEYRIYLGSALTPISTTNHFLVISGLAPGVTNALRLSYQLRDGREALVSLPTEGVTWAEDLNNDGLPDDWQARYWPGGSAAWPGTGLDDDGDGASNLQEFLAGTNPRNRDSVLRTSIQRNAQGIWLNWNSEPGLVYQVQRSTNGIHWIDLGRSRFAPGVFDSLQVETMAAALYRIIRIR